MSIPYRLELEGLRAFAYIYLAPDRLVSYADSLQATLFFYANHYFYSQVSYFDPHASYQTNSILYGYSFRRLGKQA